MDALLALKQAVGVIHPAVRCSDVEARLEELALLLRGQALPQTASMLALLAAHSTRPAAGAVLEPGTSGCTHLHRRRRDDKLWCGAAGLRPQRGPHWLGLASGCWRSCGDVVLQTPTPPIPCTTQRLSSSECERGGAKARLCAKRGRRQGVAEDFLSHMAPEHCAEAAPLLHARALQLQSAAVLIKRGAACLERRGCAAWQTAGLRPAGASSGAQRRPAAAARQVPVGPAGTLRPGQPLGCRSATAASWYAAIGLSARRCSQPSPASCQKQALLCCCSNVSPPVAKGSLEATQPALQGQVRLPPERSKSWLAPLELVCIKRSPHEAYLEATLRGNVFN